MINDTYKFYKLSQMILLNFLFSYIILWYAFNQYCITKVQKYQNLFFVKLFVLLNDPCFTVVLFGVVELFFIGVLGFVGVFDLLLLALTFDLSFVGV